MSKVAKQNALFCYIASEVAQKKTLQFKIYLTFMGTLYPQSNGPSYSNTVIGTLAVDGWAVTFGTATRDLSRLGLRSVPSSLHQILQPTHQRPVCQLRIIRCATIIASEC